MLQYWPLRRLKVKIWFVLELAQQLLDATQEGGTVGNCGTQRKQRIGREFGGEQRAIIVLEGGGD
jgi:hypothetical protein